jgi:hypothetical protein
MTPLPRDPRRGVVGLVGWESAVLAGPLLPDLMVVGFSSSMSSDLEIVSEMHRRALEARG